VPHLGTTCRSDINILLAILLPSPHFAPHDRGRELEGDARRPSSRRPPRALGHDRRPSPPFGNRARTRPGFENRSRAVASSIGRDARTQIFISVSYFFRTTFPARSDGIGRPTPACREILKKANRLPPRTTAHRTRSEGHRRRRHRLRHHCEVRLSRRSLPK
jgi:hypothetical protein